MHIHSLGSDSSIHVDSMAYATAAMRLPLQLLVL
jgi:hypothetical protein